ncbi:ABC transporter substrate-binding protein [Aldersonia kunmingensis]|uniref:ABC transporter substrate-binding protein n=1 Tax=Aldersonia kunmingensis TaxID=408066 RepID=UPI000AE9A2D6|nr:ABC transporter substrate-binding protein [Aldersonia kunmingensis]
MNISTHNRWTILPCALLAAMLVATGCSSDDKSSESTESDSSVLGPENNATGEPIKIAYASAGATAGAGFDDLPAAKATVSYINNHLGGVNGRPIELSVVCETELQVSLARDCANRAVASDAVAIVSGAEANPDAFVDVTSPAGMPFLSATPGPKTLTSPNTYLPLNALATIAGTPAYFAKQEGLKKVAVLTVDIPTATEPIKQLGALAYGNAGAAMDLVAVPPGTADMTPQVQTALDNDPDMFQIVGDTSFCTNVMKAIQTLNVEQPIVAIDACVNTSLASQIPGGYRNVKVSAISAGDDESKVFDALVDKYADYPEGARIGEGAYIAIVSLARALSGLEGELNRSTVNARLAAMPEPAPLPLASSATFQCGTKPIVVAPNICSSEGLLGTVDEDGTVRDVKPVNVAPLFAMPGA